MEDIPRNLDRDVFWWRVGFVNLRALGGKGLTPICGKKTLLSFCSACGCLQAPPLNCL